MDTPMRVRSTGAADERRGAAGGRRGGLNAGASSPTAAATATAAIGSRITHSSGVWATPSYLPSRVMPLIHNAMRRREAARIRSCVPKRHACAGG
eukprot:366082-Chlamydomonas_euryale.AAC.28